MIEIDPILKEEIKKQKLRQLMVRYIELDFDRMAHTANQLTQAAEQVQGEMDKVRIAYETIQNS